MKAKYEWSRFHCPPRDGVGRSVSRPRRASAQRADSRRHLIGIQWSNKPNGRRTWGKWAHYAQFQEQNSSNENRQKQNQKKKKICMNKKKGKKTIEMMEWKRHCGSKRMWKIQLINYTWMTSLAAWSWRMNYHTGVCPVVIETEVCRATDEFDK